MCLTPSPVWVAGLLSFTPDLVGVLLVRCVVVEVMRPGGVDSDVQRVRLDEWKAGGARVLMCWVMWWM